MASETQHAGEIPPIVAVFVERGEVGPRLPIHGGADDRSVEYDATDDANARFARAQAFGNVVSHCGSFVNLRGGNAWPDTLRRTPGRVLRVFLQDGENDLDIVFCQWLHANRQMAAALAYAGVEHRLVVGSGGHSLKHGGSLLPDTLRRLWGSGIACGYAGDARPLRVSRGARSRGSCVDRSRPAASRAARTWKA